MTNTVISKRGTGTFKEFEGLFAAGDFEGMVDPVVVSSAHHITEKLEFAESVGVYDTLGADLVALCTNDIVASGAKPAFFTAHIASDKLKGDAAQKITDSIVEACTQTDCTFIREPIEFPGKELTKDFVLSGFCVGVTDRSQLIGPELVQVGDIILGLASSGLHTDGYTLTNRVYPQLPDSTDSSEQRLSDGTELNAALLTSTILYAQPILAALEAKLPIHAAAPITAGGIASGLSQILPSGLDALVTLATWNVSPIIQEITKVAELTALEMLESTNAGIGMCVIVSPEQLAETTKHFLQDGAKVYRIGEVSQAADAALPSQVVYRTKQGVIL